MGLRQVQFTSSSRGEVSASSRQKVKSLVGRPQGRYRGPRGRWVEPGLVGAQTRYAGGFDVGPAGINAHTGTVTPTVISASGARRHHSGWCASSVASPAIGGGSTL